MKRSDSLWGWRARLASAVTVAAIAWAPGTALADEDYNLGEDLGLGVASALCSIVYAPVKIVYAAGGLIVGGMGWALSGGDNDVASAIVDPAVRGDYVVTPSVLTGKRPLEFYGKRPGMDSSDDSVASSPDW